jgi:hypothetical protein
MAQAAMVVEEPSEYEAARRRWTDFQARREAARTKVQGLEAAVQLADHRTAQPNAPASELLSRRAAEALQGATPSPRRLLQLLDDAREAAEVVETEVAAEHRTWEAARRTEHERIAIGLQPRHRAAVLAIAKAVEALSAATSAERAVRDELAATGLAPLGSGFLPDCSSALQVGTLDEWSSRASAWARDMHRIGVLR